MNSGLEVFFTQVNKPWSNALPGIYHVNVYSPTGPEKIGVPAPNGYASIDLPPGRYMVTGTLSGVYVNFDSNETLVNVGCGQRVCVTVIPRSLHFCVWWLYTALQVINERPTFAPEVAQQAKALLAPLAALEKAIPAQHRMLDFRKQEIELVRGGTVKTASEDEPTGSAAKPSGKSSSKKRR
jgi:hypothetical protein